tara:strand:+ start:321 stop:770 length:450 start_codon:yes stop_codon:yes gene_type:complete
MIVAAISDAFERFQSAKWYTYCDKIPDGVQVKNGELHYFAQKICHLIKNSFVNVEANIEFNFEISQKDRLVFDIGVEQKQKLVWHGLAIVTPSLAKALYVEIQHVEDTTRRCSPAKDMRIKRYMEEVFREVLFTFAGCIPDISDIESYH